MSRGIGVLRRHRRAVVLTFLALVGFATLGAVERFGGPLDPTERSFAVQVRNDTSAVVLLRQCGDNCRSFHEETTLAPGFETAENASDESDVTQWFLITDQAGRQLGCLGLRFNAREEGVVAPISRMVRCPDFLVAG